MQRVGSFTLGWGESLLWDERRGRLYFVDCASHELLWLDGDADSPTRMSLPSMPTGTVATEDGRIVVALDDGVHVVDVERASCDLLSPYPEGLGGRANDLCADLSGNLITGTLNFGVADGSLWRFGMAAGWQHLADGISNTNGPVVSDLEGTTTLIVGDTAAHYFAFPYDADSCELGPRRVFGDVSDLDGGPDGATLDDAGGLWAALFGGGQLVRFDGTGAARSLAVPCANPTDVTFAGPDLDRLYLVSVAGDSDGTDRLDGALCVLDGLGRGRIEPRFRLAPPW